MLELGSTIKALRKSKKIKQYEFAEQLGIHGSWLSQIERNRKKASLVLLKRVAAITGCTIGDIFIFAIIESKIMPADIVLSKPTVEVIIDYLLRSHQEEL